MMHATLWRGLRLFGLLLWLLIAALPATADTAAADVDRDGLPLSQLFPKATRSGDKQQSPPVYPLYQLDQLLGYAWVSTDINDIPGFAGKPIKLLIGLEADGRFRDVIVLDHHEPVFLHGLGQRAMDDFVAQYAGRSVTDQIIVASAQNARGHSSEGGPVYFDGVTKATISVMIINDVMLSTALQVARQKLEDFALPSQSRLRDKPFTPMDWATLVERGLVHHWYIPRDAIVTKLGRELDQYQATLQQTDHQDAFLDLWFAYLSDEDVGRNLLGERAYAALLMNAKAGDHFVWIGSSGLYRHTQDDFTPGTVPARVGLLQNGLAIELKDSNAPDDNKVLQAAGAPLTEAGHLFRVKGLTGFSPGAPMTLQLNVDLPRNHLINDQLELQDSYQLPASEWETVDVDVNVRSSPPLWLQLWQDRWLQVLILIASLLLLLGVLARQSLVSRHAAAFHRFRWAYLIFTVLFTGFYAQGQLSVVNIFTLLHALRDGFDITIFLLDPVIFILWCVTFISLFIIGRGLFCGWLCPFGALQEMSSWLGKQLGLKQIRITDRWHRRLIWLKYPILGLLVIVSFYSLTWAERLAEVEPFKTSITLVFARYWPFVVYAAGLLAASLFIHKFYCRYLCALGAGLAVIGWLHRFEWLQRIPFCGSPCQTCYSRCEIKAIKRDGSIDYNECVQCLECIVILNNDTLCADKLLAKKNKTIPIRPV